MTENSVKEPEAAPRKPLPRWKKILLGLAGGLVVAGVALEGYSMVRGKPSKPDHKVTTDPTNEHGGLAAGFDAGGRPGEGGPNGQTSGPGAENEGPTVEGLSPTMVKGGLSFFIGFCVGYAVRAFFRISAIAIGGCLILLFGLMYLGVIPPIDWSSLEGHFQTLVQTLSGKAAAFKAFIEGNLPSAGLATAGLATGVKKN